VQHTRSSSARLIDLLLKICGTTEAAARAIGATPAHLESWQLDLDKPDAQAFERLVHIIIDFQQRQIAEQHDALTGLKRDIELIQKR
jgi:hypothetical protein